MFFTPKYQSYTKTKPIRVPEELVDSILHYVQELDTYKTKTKDNKEAWKVEKLMETNIKLVQLKTETYSTKTDLIELKH